VLEIPAYSLLSVSERTLRRATDLAFRPTDAVVGGRVKIVDALLRRKKLSGHLETLLFDRTSFRGVPKTKDSPLDVARQARRTWGLGAAPIRSLWLTINRAGIATLVSEELKGDSAGPAVLAGWYGASRLILVSANWKTTKHGHESARFRFRMAVELGYLMLRRTRNYMPESAACESFARQFLVPDDAKKFFTGRNRISADEWVAMSNFWGVPFEPLVMRLRDWSLIENSQRLRRLSESLAPLTKMITVPPETPLFDLFLMARVGERPDSPLVHLVDSLWGPVEYLPTRLNDEEAKILTNSLFLAVIEGLYVVSEVLDADNPVFAEPVSDRPGRNDQWNRVVACGASGRPCRVFPSEDTFRKWRSERTRAPAEEAIGEEE
jgi:hypothetical protein